MSKVLITGSQGFIGGYIVEELLRRGPHRGRGRQPLQVRPRGQVVRQPSRRTRFVEGDARDVELLTSLLGSCDHFIAGAAMIGGISYFHTYAYDLLATNERIMAASCDAAIAAHRDGTLQKVTYISSSMVFESATSWPSAEGSEREIPPPLSSYGFQKLAVEYYARAAWDQYRLPYTIVRPFNCVGIGEGRALGDVEILSGNVKLAMSHVVPDLVQKVLKGQDPLHILGSGEQTRHYTYGGDLARGIVTAMEHPDALNEDFNLSTAREHHRARARREDLAPHPRRRRALPLRLRHALRARRAAAHPGHHQGGRACSASRPTTSLDEMLDEVVPWIESAISQGSSDGLRPTAVRRWGTPPPTRCRCWCSASRRSSPCAQRD